MGLNYWMSYYFPAIERKLYELHGITAFRLEGTLRAIMEDMNFEAMVRGMPWETRIRLNPLKEGNSASQR